ncbi:MAG: hypothetical protein ACRCZD_05670, partial [Phycicoccus sp.]
MRHGLLAMSVLVALGGTGSPETTAIGPAGRPAAGSMLPSGFLDRAVLGGLTQPTAARFAADGRIFVAEKAGILKQFD